jgi:hypothetical protein
MVWTSHFLCFHGLGLSWPCIYIFWDGRVLVVPSRPMARQTHGMTNTSPAETSPCLVQHMVSPANDQTSDGQTRQWRVQELASPSKDDPRPSTAQTSQNAGKPCLFQRLASTEQGHPTKHLVQPIASPDHGHIRTITWQFQPMARLAHDQPDHGEPSK